MNDELKQAREALAYALTWGTDTYYVKGDEAARKCEAAIAAADAALAGAREPVADKWEGGEGWESLAWELCADENGEDACSELVWEGGPMPEPWGDRWLKYEGEAKRLIALVRKHTAAASPAPDAQTPAQALKPMTAGRAEFFMERFKREEKLLGPNEQAAVDFVIAMLQAAQQEAAAPPAPDAQALPPVLFDGHAVLQALTPRARSRTSPENVADTLDAVVKLMRAAMQGDA